MRFCNAFLIWLLPFYLSGQSVIFERPVSVNLNGLAPHSSAALDISDADKGLLITPTSREEVHSMAYVPEGAAYYDVEGCLNLYRKGSWYSNCTNAFSTEGDGPSGADQILLENSQGKKRWYPIAHIQNYKLEFHSSLFQAASDDVFALPTSGEFPINVQIDPKDGFSSTANDHHFQATDSGHYYLTSTVSFNGGDGIDDTVWMRLFINGSATHVVNFINPSYFANGGTQSETLSGILLLNAGDQVDVRFENVQRPINIIERTFSGQLIDR